MITFKQLQEKAASQQQQKLMGLALAYKRGEVPEDEVSATVKGLADRMSEKDLEDFASTKHKGLPKKAAVQEAVSVKKKNYSWGRLITVTDGKSNTFPLHPEEQAKIKKLKDGQTVRFKDETGTEVTAARKGDMVHLSNKGSNKKTPVAYSHFNESLANESLWANIHKKRKEGRPMRKPGAKGAPTAAAFKQARGEQ